MTLREIRHNFIKLSGREDLATTMSVEHDIDVGADMYIDAGLMQLDLWQEKPNDVSLYTFELGANQTSVMLDRCRAIKQIYSKSDTEEVDVMDEYIVDQILVDGKIGFAKYNDASSPNAVSLLFSPMDGARTIQICGKFYSPKLVNNEDTNFWSSNFGLTLVHAALYKLEGSYRNSEGAIDWQRMIFEVLDGLDKDVAELEMPTGKLVMGGR